MKIIKGKMPGAKKTVIYGPEGIGKSTFASKFPEPLFIDTEGSTKDMDVARTEPPTSWQMLLDQVGEIRRTPNLCSTLVIDTADWAEMLCINHVCDKNQKSGIEEFGYGKGYAYVQEEFGRLLNLLEELVDVGVHIVITAHAKMRKFEQPDEMGAYDRWEMKLSKGVAPMVKEWADMVLFCNYKTMVVNVDGQGAQKGKNKAQGGRRVMYTSHHSCWDAKNRYGLPEEVEFTYASIAHIINNQATATVSARSAVREVEPTENSVQIPDKEHETASGNPKIEKNQAAVMPDSPSVGEQMTLQLKQENDERGQLLPELDQAIPKALRDLMEMNMVDEWELQNVVVAQGYVPYGTPVRDFDKVNPGIVAGLLVPSWTQVYAAIKKMREEQEVPFN